MDFVIDFLLLAASGTACLYCWILSSRLKALTNAEAGIGAGIAALSKSAQEVKSAVADSKASADDAAARIEALLVQADEGAAELRGLIEQLGEMGAAVSGQAETATKTYLEALSPFLSEANDTANRLLGALAKAPSATSFSARMSNGQTGRPSSVTAAIDEDDDLEFVVVADSKARAPKKRARSGAAA